jgi:hypothetical protein
MRIVFGSLAAAREAADAFDKALAIDGNLEARVAPLRAEARGLAAASSAGR